MQHARQKVPIEYRDQIEKALDDMVLKGVIAPVTKPTAWVSSLTYPRKPDGSLHICLNPKDLNKVIVQEHYKALTLDGITHHLSGATCFSKLDAKDGFWSIHLDEDTSYLTTFNTHLGRYRSLCAIWLEDGPGHLPDVNGPATDHLPFYGAFYGAVFTGQGMQPDPSKIQALQDLPAS